MGILAFVSAGLLLPKPFSAFGVALLSRDANVA
jgi:hypothetical protein